MNKAGEVLKRAGTMKLSGPEREKLLKDLAELKEQLSSAKPTDGDAPAAEKLQDRASLEARKRKIEDMLNKDDDLEAHGDNERARLSARAKNLEAIIKKEALTLRQSKYRSVESATQKYMDFERAVQQQMAHQKKHLKDIQEWKDIRRRLDPQNPMADNVSTLLYGI